MRLYIYLMAIMMGMSTWATEKATTEINGTNFVSQPDLKQDMEFEELLKRATQGDAKAQSNLGYHRLHQKTCFDLMILSH